MRCPECGYDSKDEAVFCESCGCYLNTTGNTTTPQPEMPQPDYGNSYVSNAGHRPANDNRQVNDRQASANHSSGYQQNANPYQQPGAAQSPYGNPQNPYGQPQAAPRTPDNAAQIETYRQIAISSMVFGILAYALCSFVIFGFIFGGIALSKSKQSLQPLRQLKGPYGFALAGKITGIVGIVGAGLMIIFWISFSSALAGVLSMYF